MASQKVVNANSTKNSGGTVIQAGNVTENNLTDLSLIKNIASKPAYGTSVVQDTAVAPFDYTDPNGVTTAKTGGTFAYTPPYGGGYLLMAAGDTNAGTINGSSSSLLTIPGGAAGQIINKNLKTTQGGTYATTKFNLLATPSSGVFPGLTRGTGAGTAITYVSTSGSTYNAVDDAATTSRAVPGELTYRFGAALPTRNVAYKAKDSNE